ncbi:hypothetical protein D3C80_1914470 [compost metagenome]
MVAHPGVETIGRCLPRESGKFSTLFHKAQRQPALIYAHQVVFDSERRWDVGDFVRTSLLHQFSEGFHFRTLNSVYLLLGPGTRKPASADTISCLI